MAEHLKALVVILGLAVPTFWIICGPFTQIALGADDFKRRRNLWLGLTVFAFVAGGFWIYMAGGAVILALSYKREPNPLALFLFLLMVVPAFSKTIPGFGGIESIVELSHLRLLSALLLLPVWLRVRREPDTLPFGRTLTDKLLLIYMIEPLLLQAPVMSPTALIKGTIYSFLDIFLPFYAASRSLRTLARYRDAIGSLLIGILLMAPMAVFEYSRSWLLYSSLGGAMGVTDKMTTYMTRADQLRVVVAATHSLALGYVLMVALALILFIRRSLPRPYVVPGCVAILACALVASGARGSWIGAAAVVLMAVLCAEKRVKQLMKVALVAGIVVAVAASTGIGGNVLQTLPFIGTADTGSVDYRQRLFDASLLVIRQHPWLGSFDYLSNPLMESMYQGEGIIDIVNSYLGVALTYGLVGLAMFLGVFSSGMFEVFRVMIRIDYGDERRFLAQSLLACLLGVLVTIATVSSISVVAHLYWILAGLCVGYVNSFSDRWNPAGRFLASARLSARA